MKNPNPLMLLRIAQADACGMGAEYLKPEHNEKIKEVLQFDHYVQHPVLTDVVAGHYTDDTQMSIAVAETLIKDNNPSVIHFTDAFLDCYDRDRRGGYSARVKNALEKALEWSDPAYALLHQHDANSTFNGAAMRAVPIGVLPDVEMVKQAALKQALITHDTPQGIISAQAVALMSHFALYYDLPFRKHLQDFVMDNLSVRHFDCCTRWNSRVAPKKDEPDGMGIITARAVFWLLSTENSLMTIMKRLLEWGGDTDSVAAIAWGIASARYQDEVLPEFMERDLEPNSAYGVGYLKDLGAKLMEKYKGG